MADCKDIEIKAWKLLAQIRGRMLSRIQHDARNSVEYCQKDPERVMERANAIANPSKWDYYGILGEADKALLEALEYMLDDEQKQLSKYKSWEPIK